MKTLDKEIMRVALYSGNEINTELYTTLILKDAYLFYSPSKVRNGQVQNGIYLSGRFQRIKIKENEKRFDFNLNYSNNGLVGLAAAQ